MLRWKPAWSCYMIMVIGTVQPSLRNFLQLNTLRPRQNGRHFPDGIFKWIFLNEIILILIKISLTFVPRGRINNIPALVQIMAWRRSGDKPLSEPVMDSLLTHICVTRPQWVNLDYTHICMIEAEGIPLQLTGRDISCSLNTSSGPFY